MRKIFNRLSMIIFLFIAGVFALSYDWTSFSKLNHPVTMPATQFCSGTTVSGNYALSGTCYMKIGESGANYSRVSLLDKNGNAFITGGYFQLNSGFYFNTHSGEYFQTNSGIYFQSNSGFYFQTNSGFYFNTHSGEYFLTNSGLYFNLYSGTYFLTHSGEYYTSNPLHYITGFTEVDPIRTSQSGNYYTKGFIDNFMAAVVGGLKYVGGLNYSTGYLPTPITTGWFYIVLNSGSFNGLTLYTQDFLISRKTTSGSVTTGDFDVIRNNVDIEHDPIRLSQSGNYVLRTAVSTATGGGTSDTLLMSQKAISGFVNGQNFLTPTSVTPYTNVFPIDIDRNGFLNLTDTKSSFDGTNTFTLTGVGSTWSYYRAGIKYTMTGSRTVNLSGGTPKGLYFIYIDDTIGTLSVSQTIWTLIDTKVPVATVYFDNTLNPKYIKAEERHTVLIDKRMHMYEHYTVGTQYSAGGLLSGYVLGNTSNTGRTFSISTANIFDEDIYETLSGLADQDGTQTGYMVAYRSGVGLWKRQMSNLPFYYSGSNTYLSWDNNGTMTASSNGNFVNTYVFLSNAINSGDNGTNTAPGRFMMIPGRGNFATAALAHAEDFSTFDMSGLPVQEGVSIRQITWQTTATGTPDGKCSMERVQRITKNISSTTQSTSFTHDSLAGLNLAGAGVTWGHINDQAQTIVGVKAFASGATDGGGNTYLTGVSTVTGLFMTLVDVTTTGSSFIINTPSFTPKTALTVYVIYGSGGGPGKLSTYFNNDTGSSYRYASSNGGGDGGTLVNFCNIQAAGNDTFQDGYNAVLNISNFPNVNKGINFLSFAFGNSIASSSNNGGCQWSTGSQITRMSLKSTDGTYLITTGTHILIYGNN